MVFIPMQPVRPTNTSAACPCLSGNPFKDCCINGAIEVVRAPPGERTGFAHPGCYARGLLDCSSKLSREHVLEESILERLQIAGGVTFENALIRGKSLPPSAAAAKILCERHNNSSSGLDAIGLALFLRLEQPLRAGLGNLVFGRRTLFSGMDVERFLLKLAANYLASGWSGKVWEVPVGWPEIIWGTRPIEQPCGLYISVRRDEPQLDARIRMRVICRYGPNPEHDRPVGCEIRIFSVAMLICVDLDRPQFSETEDNVYRPAKILIRTRHGDFGTELDYGAAAQRGAFFAELDSGRVMGAHPDSWTPPRSAARRPHDPGRLLRLTRFATAKLRFVDRSEAPLVRT